MTEAEKAFEAAERMIEAARESGADALDFGTDETRALERLPDSIATLGELRNLQFPRTSIWDLMPISGLADLEWLDAGYTNVVDCRPIAPLTKLRGLILDGTAVRDLTPLGTLKRLSALWLYGTPVTDLRPIIELDGISRLGLDGSSVVDLKPTMHLIDLLEDPSEFGEDVYLGVYDPFAILDGLTFVNCTAAKTDPRIAEISEITNSIVRAQTLFDYLKTWEPPDQPDTLFSIQEDDDRLEVAASTPSEAERDERLKQVLHDRLKTNAAALAQQAGNRFARLAGRARALVREVECDFGDLDMLMLHLAVDDLRDLEALGREDEDGEAFPPEIVIALGDVLRAGPGLTLGNADVDELVERANRRRAAPTVPDAELNAQDGLSAALVSDEDAIGERLRALEAAVAGSNSAEDREAQKGANRSVLWRIAVWGTAGAATLATGVTVNAISPPVIAWVQAHGPALLAAAQTYGPAFYDWFVMSVGQVPQFSGLIDTPPRRTKRD